MPKQKLREILAELHEALAEADAVDPALHDPLRETMGEIRDVLDAGDDAEPASEPHTLADRVAELAVEFEGAHPLIAGTLNRMTHLLSSLGI